MVSLKKSDSKKAESNKTDVSSPEADSRQRVLILIGIGVGLLALAFFVPKVLFGGGDDEVTFDETTSASTSSIPGSSPSQPGSSATSTTTTTPIGPLPESYEVFATRNPFTPLVALESGAGSGADAGTGAGTDPGTGTGDGTGTNPPSPDTGNEPRVQQKIALLDVSGSSNATAVVTVTVDGVVYQPRTNEIFATNYKVVAIDLGAKCANFLLGDDAFILCVNEEIRK